MTNEKSKNQKYNLFISIMTLAGVIVGALITGFFTIKSQKLAIEAMDKKTAIEYSIAKNELLITYVEDFINETVNFLTLVSSKDVNQDTLNQKYYSLIGVSLKILAISDFNIGKESVVLVARLSVLMDKQAVNDLEIEDIKEFIEPLIKWTIAVKAEMKIADYTVNDKELEKDLYRYFIANILSGESKENE